MLHTLIPCNAPPKIRAEKTALDRLEKSPMASNPAPEMQMAPRNTLNNGLVFNILFHNGIQAREASIARPDKREMVSPRA